MKQAVAHTRQQTLKTASLFLALSLFPAIGCGPDDLTQPNNSRSQRSYQYQFSSNGCDTGQQRFSSFEEVCQGLQNNDLNRHCAPSLRYDEFVRLHCPGEFRDF